MTSTIDARGLECPEPKRRVIAALEEKGWEEMTVLTDAASAHDGICVLLDVHGFAYTTEHRPAHWEIRIRRTPGEPNA